MKATVGGIFLYMFSSACFSYPTGEMFGTVLCENLRFEASGVHNNSGSLQDSTLTLCENCGVVCGPMRDGANCSWTLGEKWSTVKGENAYHIQNAPSNTVSSTLNRITGKFNWVASPSDGSHINKVWGNCRLVTDEDKLF